MQELEVLSLALVLLLNHFGNLFECTLLHSGLLDDVFGQPIFHVFVELVHNMTVKYEGLPVGQVVLSRIDWRLKPLFILRVGC